MNEDFKYLIASYQTTANDLFTQSIATNAKIRQLNDLINVLNEKVKSQEEKIKNLSKVKEVKTGRNTKSTVTKADNTF